MKYSVRIPMEACKATDSAQIPVGYMANIIVDADDPTMACQIVEERIQHLLTPERDLRW